MSDYGASSIPWPPQGYAEWVFEQITADLLLMSERPASEEARPHLESVGRLYGLLADCYPRGRADEFRGATYKTLAHIGHLVGMDALTRADWYGICANLGVTQRHASHMIARIHDGTFASYPQREAVLQDESRVATTGNVIPLRPRAGDESA